PNLQAMRPSYLRRAHRQTTHLRSGKTATEFEALAEVSKLFLTDQSSLMDHAFPLAIAAHSSALSATSGATIERAPLSSAAASGLLSAMPLFSLSRFRPISPDSVATLVKVEIPLRALRLATLPRRSASSTAKACTLAIPISR